MRWMLSFVFAVAMLAAPCGIALGAPGATALVRKQQEELARLLRQPKSSGVHSRIEAVLDALIDYNALAERSLDRHWAKCSSEQRKEFSSVLKGLVRTAYRKHLGKTLDYSVAYEGERAVAGGILVRSVAKHRTNPRKEKVSIDYALHRVEGRWLVYDIVTEGESLVNNYRQQFRRIIKKKGFDELMRRLKKKLASRS